MQEERLRLRGLRVGALPILNRFIERMGLEEELTLALKNPGYADALFALIAIMPSTIPDRRYREMTATN